MAAAAAADSVQRIKAEVTCSICRELLRDPVTTACGHSFCKRCITRICKGREDAACPQCRQGLQKRDFRLNRELKNIVELLKSRTTGKPAGWTMCERHQEPMKLYCKKDKSPICVVCMQSEAHCGHKVVPKEEAVKEYKEKIAEQLESIESSCGKLDQFVSEVWKHLSENEKDEEHHKLARVSEKLTTVLQVQTESPGKRSEDKDSKPKESPPESDSSESDDSEETERQGHSGREPGSEPAAETREETGSHVGRVGQKDPTRECELGEESSDEEAPRRRRRRFADPASQTQYWLSPESEFPWWVVSERTEQQGHSGIEPGSEPAAETLEETGSHVSPVGQKDPTRKCEGSSDEEAPRRLMRRSGDPASQTQYWLSPESDSSESDDSKETERQGHSGREPGREPAAETREETRSHVGEETPTTTHGLSQGSLDDAFHKISGTRGDAEPKVAVKETRKRTNKTKAAEEGQQHPGKKRKL